MKLPFKNWKSHSMGFRQHLIAVKSLQERLWWMGDRTTPVTAWSTMIVQHRRQGTLEIAQGRFALMNLSIPTSQGGVLQNRGVFRGYLLNGPTESLYFGSNFAPTLIRLYQDRFRCNRFDRDWEINAARYIKRGVFQTVYLGDHRSKRPRTRKLIKKNNTRYIWGSKPQNFQKIPNLSL